MKIAFVALAGSVLAITSAHAFGTPYRNSGVATCTAPGTSIEFVMDGSGNARVTGVQTNYAGFRQAARVKVWKVLRAEKDNTSLIVFDNGQKSRIMNIAGSQKAMGFLADGGVSDMLCQVLVQAR